MKSSSLQAHLVSWVIIVLPHSYLFSPAFYSALLSSSCIFKVAFFKQACHLTPPAIKPSKPSHTLTFLPTLELVFQLQFSLPVCFSCPWKSALSATKMSASRSICELVDRHKYFLLKKKKRHTNQQLLL